MSYSMWKTMLSSRWWALIQVCEFLFYYYFLHAFLVHWTLTNLILFPHSNESGLWCGVYGNMCCVKVAIIKSDYLHWMNLLVNDWRTFQSFQDCVPIKHRWKRHIWAQAISNWIKENEVTFIQTLVKPIQNISIIMIMKQFSMSQVAFCLRACVCVYACGIFMSLFCKTESHLN